MRWVQKCLVLAAASFLVGGCGVGPEAGQLAQRESKVLAQMAEDDESVRQSLIFQADAWNALALQLTHKQIGGVPVGADFRELVLEIGQLARRQRALIQAGEDDPESNRKALSHLKKMWGHAAEYLKP